MWISIGVAFSLVVWWWFGGQATGEYISGYLIEKSLSVDNVFVWALMMTLLPGARASTSTGCCSGASSVRW